MTLPVEIGAPSFRWVSLASRAPAVGDQVLLVSFPEGFVIAGRWNSENQAIWNENARSLRVGLGSFAHRITHWLPWSLLPEDPPEEEWR